MKPEDFAARLCAVIVDENSAIYKDLLTAAPSSRSREPHWERVHELYAALTPEQRMVLLDLVRQVVVDSVSNVVAILDGVASFGSDRERFILTSTSDPQQINGNLQDLFLEAEERRRQ